MKFLKKQTAAARQSQREKSVGVVDFEQAYPATVEYLTIDQYDDKTPRITSTLSISIEDGAFKIGLTDRENERSAFVTGISIEDALVSLEINLQADTCDWRYWKRNQPKGSQKGKK